MQLIVFSSWPGKKPGGSQHIATFYPKILPWRVVNVIPLWGAVTAIRLRESFLTKAQRNLRTVRFLLTLAGKFIWRFRFSR